MNGTVSVWTLLFGDQVWKREGRISHADGRIAVTLDPLARPRPIVGGPDSDVPVAIRIPHAKLLNHCNILLFDGLIPPGGMNGKVQRLETSVECNRIGVRINSSNTKKVHEGDFESPAFTTMRWEALDETTQEMFVHVVAIPKGDVRMLVLTFHDRSLEPWYRMIRSLPDRLAVETVNSY